MSQASNRKRLERLEQAAARQRGALALVGALPDGQLVRPGTLKPLTSGEIDKLREQFARVLIWDLSPCFGNTRMEAPA